MSRRALVFMAITFAFLAGGTIYLHVLAQRFASERSAPGEASARTRLSQAALQSTGGSTQSVTLYFPSYDEGKLLAENRQIAWATGDTDRIRQILLALIEGSHQGHSSTLPSSADIRAVFLTSDGTAYLDFSNALLADFAPGIESESLAIYSIVESVATNIPAVKRVKILIQGQEMETLDGHAELGDYFVPEAPAQPAASR